MNGEDGFRLEEEPGSEPFIKRLIKYRKDPCKKCLVAPCCAHLCAPKTSHAIFWKSLRHKQNEIVESAYILEVLISGLIVVPLFVAAWITGFIDVDLKLPLWITDLINLIW